MNKLFEAINKSQEILISGHIRPDGDSIGACLALGQYINEVYGNKKVTLYLESMPNIYSYLKGQELIVTQIPEQEYDLVIALDCGDKERLGEAFNYFQKASSTFNIDHHISNDGYGKENLVVVDASSTSEIIYNLLDPSKISKNVAEALYTGIVFDTGIFKHSSTTKKTLEIVGALIEFGFNFSEIIDRIFFEKTFEQNKILGKALENSEVALDGLCCYSYLTSKDFLEYQGSHQDTDGIIDQLRVTKGVKVAFFLYEAEENHFKMSLRSNDQVDVCRVAQFFGGGGHTKASGCSAKGSLDEIISQVLDQICRQLVR